MIINEFGRVKIDGVDEFGRVVFNTKTVNEYGRKLQEEAAPPTGKPTHWNYYFRMRSN